MTLISVLEKIVILFIVIGVAKIIGFESPCSCTKNKIINRAQGMATNDAVLPVWSNFAVLIFSFFLIKQKEQTQKEWCVQVFDIKQIEKARQW